MTPVTELTFLGAARTVTGSKYLLSHGGETILFDCGLFQGLKTLRERNWEDFPVAPSSIRAVVLTHAHLDHVGYLPRLVAKGFDGRAFCTSGTADLCRLVLPDSGRIQEEDARQANRHGYSRHQPAQPLYDEAAANRALTHLYQVSYRKPLEIATGVTIEFVPAGHLLGSAFVIVRLSSGKTILFGGDLGRYGRPVLPDPADPVAADLVLVESTYGDRDHPADDDGESLARVIRDTAARGGKVIVPAFAIGRVEELLYWIARLERARRIPVLPVYVDSPMATDALKFYASRSIGARPGDSPDDETRHCVCHGAIPDHGVAPAVEGAHRQQAQRGRDLGQRHGHGRARPPSSGGRVAGSPQHRALRRVSGRRHARTPADRGRLGGQDPRARGSRTRAYRKSELDVGSRRQGRDPALVEGHAGATRTPMPCARGAGTDGRLEGLGT